MPKKRSKKLALKYSRIMIVFMCLILVVNIAWPDQKTSASENRSLQTFPEWSLEDIKSGRYTTNLSNWFSDQFVGRNAMIHLKYLTQKTTGTKKIDDVFLGHGTLIEDVSPQNEKQLKRNLKAINQFQETTELSTSFVLVPNAVSVQSNQLPLAASTENQSQKMDEIYSQMNDSIQKIDVRNTLEQHKEEYLYYHSDHHWTSLGAYYSFQKMASDLSLEEVSKKNYTIYNVTNSFKGTLANKTGSVGIKDDIDIYVPENNPDYIMTDESNGTKSRTIFSSEGLESNDPYTVFLNGNHSLVQLEMNNDSSRHLLLFKDSYANAMISFLIPYYRTITIVDPRYYTEDLTQVMNSNMFTEVMYLYNYNTFVQDTSLADVLNSTKEEE